MNLDTQTASFSENDIINALDLDRDNIQYIDVHHDHGDGLVIELKLAPKPTPCPICNTMTTKIKVYRTRHIQHSIFNTAPCVTKLSTKLIILLQVARVYLLRPYIMS